MKSRSLTKRKDSRTKRRNGKVAALAFWALVLVICIVVILYIAVKPGPEPPKISATQPQANESGSADRRIVRQQFFDKHAIPAIEAANKANQEAESRCLNRIAESFRKYHEGVQPFAEDMTSLSTRFGVVRRMPSDWWHETNEIHKLVAGKLEKHVFSEERLRKDIDNSLAQFRDDIKANNTKMLTSIKAATTGTQLPSLQDLNIAEFTSDVVAKIESYSTDSATESVTGLILTEAASGAAGLAVEQIIAAVIVRVGASAGGATAGSAAVGGGGGSLGGPIGAGVGIAGGLVVGLVIDYWLTERAKESLSGSLNTLLDEIEDAVINGATFESEGATQKRIGLKEALDTTTADLDKAYRQILQARIVGDET
ncbi:hypothetical protein [Blastopirellula marina]|nr:hypothetical protein [Blastopirellula marina]